MRRAQSITVIALSISLLLAGCLGGEDEYTFNGEAPKGELETNDFTLIDQHGDNWSLSDSQGNVTIITFIFTRCPDVCIAVSMNINIVLDGLDQEAREQVQVVSVTVDPWSDTPEEMLAFSDSRSADWPHLTSPNAGNMSDEFTDLSAVWGEYQLSLEVVDTTEDDGHEHEHEGEYTVLHALPTFILDRGLTKRVVWLGSEWDPVPFREDLQHLIDE